MVDTPQGFVSVTKAHFFAAIGPLNVNPLVDVASFKTPGATLSNWEMPNRMRVGVSIGHHPHTKFFLAGEYAAKAAG